MGFMMKKKVKFFMIIEIFTASRIFLGVFVVASILFLSKQVSVAAPFTCGLQTLKGASGVIGIKHSYALSGACSESWTYSKETNMIGGTAKNAGYSIQVIAKAEWDRVTGLATENLKLTGDVNGERTTSGTCTQDPFLKNPPDGFGSCANISSTIQLTSGELWKSLTINKFWFAQTVTLSVAQALSAQKDTNSPPPPPPPPKTNKPEESVEKPRVTVSQPLSAMDAVMKPPQTSDVPARPSGESSTPARMQPESRDDGRTADLQQPDSNSVGRTPISPRMLDFEAEDLLTAKKILVKGGRTATQPMISFGSGWSNNTQLFWSGGEPGAVLDMIIDVPSPALYAVELYMTRAPDYGNLRIEVDGKTSSVHFNGYSPKVIGANPVQAGKFSLQAGQRMISLMITDKYSASSGYYAGIDRIKLYPVGAP
jgi:hypothetical protein